MTQRHNEDIIKKKRDYNHRVAETRRNFNVPPEVDPPLAEETRHGVSNKLADVPCHGVVIRFCLLKFRDRPGSGLKPRINGISFYLRSKERNQSFCN